MQSKVTASIENIFDRWGDLSLRHLAAFTAVSETGSIARAADRLGYTQPAVSHQIARLERLLDTRLFDRRSGRGQATLTSTGRLLAQHVAALERRLAAAEADLEASKSGARAAVRLGAFQSVTGRIVPPLVQRLADDEPRLSLELVERTEESDLIAALSAGRLDYAFVLLPLVGEELEAVALFDDPYLLIAGDDAGLPPRLDSLAELRDRPIVAPRSCRSWSLVEDELHAAGVEPNYLFRTDDNHAIKALVQGGTGVAIVSRLALLTMGDGVQVTALDDLLAPRRIGLAWSGVRQRLPHHERLLAAIRAACGDRATGWLASQ